MPRWTGEIEDRIPAGATQPTYRLWDLWTRKGYLTAEHKTGQGGKFRDWPEPEVQVGLLAARLKEAGLTDDLAFTVGRAVQAQPGATRRVRISGDDGSAITVEVQGRTTDE